MSQYSSIIKKLQKFITSKNIITDTGSTKRNIINIINKNNKIKDIFIPSHPIAGSEVSGPKYGNKDLFKNKWCIILNNGNKKKLRKLKFFGKNLVRK